MGFLGFCKRHRGFIKPLTNFGKEVLIEPPILVQLEDCLERSMVFRVSLLREALERHLPVLMLHVRPTGLGQVNASDEVLPILLGLGFLCLVIGLEVLHVFAHFPGRILVGLRLHV